ncbi:MAG: prolipoprotein diacylglyceryl transferase [Chloroflexi bacterium]|nr:prolipoprotein diacylglyceryl transferase [Chloroflexota bacterium]
MEYAFKIGSFGLRWYSLLIVIGLLAGALVAQREAKRRGEDPNHVFSALVVCLVLALIGARAYHVIDQWQYYRENPQLIPALWKGGIGIFGAIVGSITGMFIYARLNHLSVPRWLDIGAPGLILVQAIGRWGNYFNQELYGRPTNLPWGINIDLGHRVEGYTSYEKFHPLFFYESMWNLLSFVILLFAARRFAGRLRDGDIVLLYGMLYPLGRFLLEFLRIGNWKAGELPVAQIISVVAFVACGTALWYRHRHRATQSRAARRAMARAAMKRANRES